MDWHDRTHATRTSSRTDPAIEDLVLTVRTELEQSSDLGFHGAAAIHNALKGREIDSLPSVRTINRSSNDGESWMARNTLVGPRHDWAGISPRLPRSGGNWTASMWSKGWSSREVPKSRC